MSVRFGALGSLFPQQVIPEGSQSVAMLFKPLNVIFSVDIPLCFFYKVNNPIYSQHKSVFTYYMFRPARAEVISSAQVQHFLMTLL
jgi:hypothetical protein